MRLSERFEVAVPVAEVWSFIEQPEAVAGCVPGVEQLSVRSPDDIDVRISQSIGPMSATFSANVQVTEREAEKRICFTVQGKSVRGAAGNVRANVEVGMLGSATGTEVTVNGDVALAGALGSVGQKVVAKQAGKVTAQFARNLAESLGAPGAAPQTVAVAGAAAVAGNAPAAGAVRAFPPVSEQGPDRTQAWAKLAVVFSGIAAAASLAVLLREVWAK